MNGGPWDAEGDALGSAGEAVVVFSGQTDLPWLRLLKPGYRHCFVVLPLDGTGAKAWVIVDPLAHCTRICLAPGGLAGDARAVAAAYGAHGLEAVVVAVREPPRRLAPLRPYTCVEAVKRLIGRRAPWVVTPWQLHRALSREDKSLKQENNLDIELRPG